MIERIRKKYAMTEKGARDYVSAVFWSVLVNISKMLPVGVLATALSGIVEALTNGTDPGAGLTRFLVAGILALAALFVTFLIQYKALYEATYRESANRRIRLAEVLRQLPLSFFGNRDLTDLTTTIMGDTETLEKAFSHFYPAMHGALISTALISAGMLLYDWRMALALLWVVPASLLMVYLSRRMEKRHIKKGLVTRRAATDAMQEVLECAPEIKACNQKARYIADLNRRLDEAEQDTIRGELFTGSVVTAAQSFLKLGIATTVLTGVLLMSRGDLSLIPFLMFLIAATRVWLRTDGNVSVCSMLRRDLPGFLCQGAKGSAARKGVRTVKTRLGSVQVETQDGDDQLRLDPAADLLVHSKAGIAVLVIPSAHGQSLYVAGIVIQHLVHRLWVAPHGGDHRIRDQAASRVSALTHSRHLPSAFSAARRPAACGC